jgi:sec-independent protein translocase protein TatC
MSLYDHLRELRYRVVVSLIAVAVTFIVAAFFYRSILAMVTWPYYVAVDQYVATTPGARTDLINKDMVSPLMVALKAALMFGLIAASPVWLYQLWSFIVPALLDQEKKYAKRFIAAAIPLFLSGCALGYFILPTGFAFMLSFTIPGVLNLQDIDTFVQLEMTLILLFGVSFLLPLVLVMLNLLGIVTGKQLGAARNYAIFGCFLFGAMATPSADPFSMTALAAPMAVMYVVAELIARRHDAGKAARQSTDEFAVSID